MDFKEQLKEAYERLKQQKTVVTAINKPFMLPTLSKKQRIELSHIGKLVMLLNGEVSLFEQRDKPDFIIQHQQMRIGLEHEVILVNDKTAVVKSTEQLFDKAADVFKNQYPAVTFLANCWLTVEEFSFKKSDVPGLAQNIADFMYHTYMKKDYDKRPNFIKRITFHKSSHLSFKYNPGAYAVPFITGDVLAKAIDKKNKKLSDYISQTGLPNQWLLLVIGSAGRHSYDFEEKIEKINIISGFERIYLMEDLYGRLFRLK